MPDKNVELEEQRYQLLNKVDDALEGPMVFLGFIWLILLIVELINGLNRSLQFVSYTIWVVFIIDFAIKLVLAPKKLYFLRHNWLTAISLVVPALRMIRMLRFVRLFRAVRGLRLVKVVASINRSMASLNATMQRRGLKYVLLLTLVISLAGAAGMYTFEKDVEGGLTTFTSALWWTFMLVITIGSEYWPHTPEGRILCFLLALYGFAVFGYITATLASFFIGRDAEEKDAPIASTADIEELRLEIRELTKVIVEMKNAGK